MKLQIYVVDAFTDKMFSGNQAAVIPLPHWLADKTLQNIAAENNLSETAFVVGSGADFEIRWMTPTVEMDLCGHATLAAAHVLLNELGSKATQFNFRSKGGTLHVRPAGGLLTLDFPSRPGERLSSAPLGLCEALGARPQEIYQSRDILAVFETEKEILNLAPDFAALGEIETAGIIVTAPGRTTDFVSRFFAPRLGVPEDPVTGSSHCTLTPYWAQRLSKLKLYAKQISARGGELFVELKGERVEISGKAVTYLRGEIDLLESATL